MAGVSAEEIVQAAYQLQGAPYRPWRSGNSIPMFLDDGPFMDAFFQGGHEAGLAGLRSHLQDVGVMGVDLIHFALIANRMYEMGLDSGGTGTFGDYLVRTGSFAPDTPGQRGAIALRPYQGPDPYYGGPDGFEHVLDLVEEASEGLLEDVRERHLSRHG